MHISHPFQIATANLHPQIAPILIYDLLCGIMDNSDLHQLGPCQLWPILMQTQPLLKLTPHQVNKLILSLIFVHHLCMYHILTMYYGF